MNVTKCLLIDDSEADHLLMELEVKKILQQAEVIHAYDGAEALEMLSQLEQECPMILLDLNMPGMNGHEFLAQYASRKECACPVLVVTSSTREDEKQRCLQYDFVKGYFVKPLLGEQLAVTLN